MPRYTVTFTETAVYTVEVESPSDRFDWFAAVDTQVPDWYRKCLDSVASRDLVRIEPATPETSSMEEQEAD